MILLTTSASAQTLTFIPRVYAGQFTLAIRDDSTNIIKNYEVTSTTTSGNYLVVSQAFNPVLVENHFYDLTLYSDPNYWNTNYNLWQEYEQVWNLDTTDIIDIYKDKIFVTNQDVNQDFDQYYNLNQGQYTTNNSYNNDYIVI